MAEAKKWIEANPDAWRFMLSNARRLKEKGYVSINYLVNMVRNELHVGCKNGIAPALARIMEARYLELRGAFNKHRSQSDGFSELAGGEPLRPRRTSPCTPPSLSESSAP